MIKVRLKSRPNEVVTYRSRKEVLDLERWGQVLEYVEDDEAPKHDEGNAAPEPEAEPAVNNSGSAELVLNKEQLEEAAGPSKRTRRKKTSSDDSEGERE